MFLECRSFETQEKDQENTYMGEVSLLNTWWVQQVLKCVVCENHYHQIITYLSWVTHYSNIGTQTVYLVLHGMGFHGQAATHKPHITM